MRLLPILQLAALLVLAGCAANPDSQPASFNAHVNGSYTAFGGVALGR